MPIINFWNLMVVKDDYILSGIELLLKVKKIFDFKTKSLVRESKKIIASKQRNGKDVFVILNGPSVKNQDLSKIIGEDIIFVNRGFLHPLFKELKPKYHVFIDTKMIYGIWDVKWIDQIIEMVPDITIVLPAEWAKLQMFESYLAKDISIIWFASKGSLRGLGVSGTSFDLAIALGYSKIYFTGFEATGFAQNLLKQSTHFFGHVDDNELQNAEDYMKGYYMNCRQIRELILYARMAKKKKVDMINLTEGGLLDMFERKDFNNFKKNK
jgi:hypothetical protein